MVFPASIPDYLDPPNWHQQQNEQQANGNRGRREEVLLEMPAAAQGAMKGAKKMMMMMQQQGAEVKCPRCESTNTKFCYFNNYSLSQPRHFCKTCRRYWTRGGALRNVPVGGGCRRPHKKTTNKRIRSPQAPPSATCQVQTMVSSEPWRLQPHLPNFFTPFDSFSSYPIHAEPLGMLGIGDNNNNNNNNRVKLEGGNGGGIININHNNQQYYSWSDLSALASSSSLTHLL